MSEYMVRWEDTRLPNRACYRSLGYKTGHSEASSRAKQHVRTRLEEILDAVFTEREEEIEWTFYGIAEHTVSAAVAFEAVHNQIQEWAAQMKGVSKRNSYCLGVADGLVRLAETTKEMAEEEARQYETQALAARITEEDMKQQVKLYRLYHPPAEPTPAPGSDDEEMDINESDHAGDAEGPDVSDNDCRVLPNYSERYTTAETAIQVDITADVDTELSKFMVPDPFASTENLNLPLRDEFLDDDNDDDVTPLSN